MMKHFTLEIEDAELIAKINDIANNLQVSPDEAVSRIIGRYVYNLDVANNI